LSRKNRALESQQQSTKMNFENAIPFDRSRSRREVPIIPKTITQEKYLLALNDDSKNIVLAYGPAGTGKTYLAMQVAVRALRTGVCTKLILTRPAVAVEEEDHGFLPGDLNQKMEPWTRPLFDVLRECYSPREIEKLLDEQTVEISPLAFVRGRTFKDAWIIFDEAQNSTSNQMKAILTRLGANSKIVVTGDLNQVDRRFVKDNGLLDFIRRAKECPSSRVASVEYSLRDVQRHPVVVDVLKMYGE